MKRYANILASVILALALSVGVAHAWPTWTGTSVLTIATDNNTSAGISIPRACSHSASVIIPTVTSGTVALHVSNDDTTYYAFYYQAGAAASPAAWVTGSGTHNYATELPRGALDYKYFRFETSAEQAANRTFTVTCQ